MAISRKEYSHGGVGVGRDLGKKMTGQELVITEAADMRHTVSFYFHINMHVFYFHK